MSEIKIDKGVPLPEPSKRGPKHVYPWEKLQVGDSFFVPGKKTNTFGGQLTRFKKSAGIKCVIRTVTENNVKGVRIWRIE